MERRSERIRSGTLMVVILLSVLASVECHGQAEFSWVCRIDGTGVPDRMVSAASVGVDTMGNVYAAGSYDDELEFRGPIIQEGTVPMVRQTLSSEGNYATPFLAKYTDAGVLQWAKLVAVGVRGAFGFVVDGGGNSYFTGTNVDDIQIGEDSVYGGEDHGGMYVVKCDSSGRPIWARGGGGQQGSCSGHAVTVDSDGNVYVVGDITTLLTGREIARARFGETELEVKGRELFVVKYDRNGTMQWVSRGEGYNEARGVAVGSDGSVYVTGIEWEHVGEDTLGRYRHLVLLKYGSEGVMQWKRVLQGIPTWIEGGRRLYVNPESEGHGVAVEGEGSVYVAGSLYGIYRIAGDSISTVTDKLIDGEVPYINTDMLVVKYDPEGEAQWARSEQWGGRYAKGVIGDSEGGCYAVGEMRQVMHYSGEGIVEPIKGIGGYNVYMYGVSKDRNRNLYVMATIFEKAIFDADTIVDTVRRNPIYIVKIRQDGVSEVPWRSEDRGEGRLRQDEVSVQVRDGKIVVELPMSAERSRVRVIDVMGREAYYEQMVVAAGCGHREIDVSGYPCGVYWVEVIVGGRRSVQGVVIPQR